MKDFLAEKEETKEKQIEGLLEEFSELERKKFNLEHQIMKISVIVHKIVREMQLVDLKLSKLEKK